MKKQIIFEYDIDKDDNFHRVTVSTPHHDRFDIYIESADTLKRACENIIKLIGNDPKFFLDFFGETGFSLNTDSISDSITTIFVDKEQGKIWEYTETLKDLTR